MSGAAGRLESDNDIVLGDESAWAVIVSEVEAFLAPKRAAWPGPERRRRHSVLSARELKVLRLAAGGHDNEQIACALTLSVRTVERHPAQHLRQARAAAVARLLTPAL